MCRPSEAANAEAAAEAAAAEACAAAAAAAAAMEPASAQSFSIVDDSFVLLKAHAERLTISNDATDLQTKVVSAFSLPGSLLSDRTLSGLHDAFEAFDAHNKSEVDKDSFDGLVLRAAVIFGERYVHSYSVQATSMSFNVDCVVAVWFVNRILT